MTRVSTYLNFDGNAEEAFSFYARVFGTEMSTPLVRFGDGPSDPAGPPLAEADRQKVLHAPGRSRPYGDGPSGVDG